MNNLTAFPVQSVYIEDQETNSRGMTLRDYMAAKAMPIYLQRFGSSEGFSQLETCILVADWSYEMADAMLAEREKS